MPRDTTPRRPEVPAEGFYKVRLVRRAHWYPVRIEQNAETGDWFLTIGHAEVQGDTNPWAIPEMEKVYFYGHVIDEAEYRYLLDLITWAQENDPDHAILTPRIARDPAKMKPVF